MKPVLHDGDFHLVISHARRTMKAFDHTGRLLWTAPALTEGVNDDVDLPGGDTPMGLYKCGKITVTSAHEPKRTWDSYGHLFIDLVELENQEASRGRAGVGIHGGGTGLEDPLAGMQPLLATLGCVRVHNRDLRALIAPLVRAAEHIKTTVYVTVTN